MKFLFVLFVTLISYSVYSQNTGIDNENNVLKLTYKGKFDEMHKFQIVNKLNCDMLITTDKNGEFSDHNLQSKDTLFVSISSSVHPTFAMRARKKNGGACEPQPDNGWVEINSSSLSLPIVFWTPLSITQPVNNKSYVQWGGDETSFTNLSHYQIVYSTTGNFNSDSKKIYRIVTPKNQKATYRETININELKKN